MSTPERANPFLRPARQPDPRVAAGDRPNIIVITSDDQTREMLSPKTMPATWRLLVEPGLSFDNYIVSSPLCCPDRASFLTGQYPHNHRVLGNHYGELVDKQEVLPAWLRDSGYQTIHVGKYLNNYEVAVADRSSVAPGWTDWYTFLQGRYFDYNLYVNGATEHFGTDDADYLPRVLNRIAVDSIARYGPAPRPFYLQLDQFPPHFGSGPSTQGCEGAAVPDPRDTGRRTPQIEPTPWSKPSFNEPDFADKPPYMRDTPPLSRLEQRRLREHFGCALRSLRAIDRGVAAIVGQLRRVGELNRTVIIFTSDNGYLFGEHRIPEGKEFPYREAFEVPLVIRAPPRLLVAKLRGTTNSAPVANIDLAPTILDWAKTTPCLNDGRCRSPDGASLAPFLRDQPDAWPSDRDRLIELGLRTSDREQPWVCAFSALLGRSRLYVEHSLTARRAGRCEKSRAIEDYDLGADPWQLDNLHRPGGGPSGAERNLRRRLHRLADCRGSRIGSEQPLRRTEDNRDADPYCD